MRRFILELAVRAAQNGGHHRQRTEGRGDHVAHDVAVVVLQCPDEAAFAADDARDRIVDQCVEVLEAEALEFFFVALVVDLLEDVAETHIVLLGDGVFRGEPQILLGLDRILEAGMREGLNGGVLVVDALQDARALKVVDGLSKGIAVLAGEDELRLALFGDAVLGALVQVAVRMTGNGDRLLPVLHDRLDAVDGDRGAEDGAVEDSTDGAVRALPHLMEMVLFHALCVRGDGRALDADAVLLDRLAGILGDLVTGLVTERQAEVVVLGLQIYERKNELIFDHLPEDSGHFVAVHLDERSCHFDFVHGVSFICSALRSSSSGSLQE